MSRRRPAATTRYSLFDRLEAALVTVVFVLLPCAIYWFALNRSLAGTPWQMTGQGFLEVLAGAALLGFVFPRAIPGVVGALWDGIINIGTYWH